MQPSIVVVSGPSGSGKTSLARKAIECIENCYFSISTTTRKPRDGEIDGIDYFFISKDEFLRDIDEGGFVEWAEVHGNFYGTSYKPIEKALAEQQSVILDIDVQGHKSIRDRYADLVTSVFVTTKNVSVLKERLTYRNTETPETLEQRVMNAVNEMRRINEYDYFLINDDFAYALGVLESIITVSRYKQSITDKENFLRTWKI